MPRCACDVPAHNYTYSFEPKHDWSSVYASSSEIKAYFETFCDKYHLRHHIKTSHRVEHAQWLESEGRWTVYVSDTKCGRTIHDQCDILINASGYLNKWAWPNVPGRDLFKGQMLHSASWDDEVQLEGKSVTLVGNG